MTKTMLLSQSAIGAASTAAISLAGTLVEAVALTKLKMAALGLLWRVPALSALGWPRSTMADTLQERPRPIPHPLRPKNLSR